MVPSVSIAPISQGPRTAKGSRSRRCSEFTLHPADCEFDHPPSQHAQRMSGLTGRTAAIDGGDERLQWAVREDGPLGQISIASAIANASSSSTPRYLKVLSILVWPNSN